MSSPLVAAILERVKTMPGEALIVIDPHGLVRCFAVLDELRVQEVDVVVWDEPLGSRWTWEDPRPAGGRLVVVDGRNAADCLPADVAYEATRRVSLAVDDLFGPLHRSIVIGLEWADREAAFEVAAELPAAALDPEHTASILLRRLHRLDPQVMDKPDALLDGLLRHHLVLRAMPMSVSLARHFSEQVGDTLPALRTLDALTDRGAFIGWLQEVWDRAATESGASELRSLLLAEGPAQGLDDYFSNGTLRPVPSEASVPGLPFGVSNDEGAERRRRVQSGIAEIEATLDRGDLTYDEWRTVAQQWAEVLATEYIDAYSAEPRIPALRARLEEAFWLWLPEHYPELATLPTIAVPAMVHRSIRPLEVASRAGKVALVVVDGLSLAVWRSILPIIRGKNWRVVEAATFAWLPTITAVSRQTIFSGKPPMFFASSIDTTAKEPALWRELWSEVAKLPEHNVGYAKVHLRNVGRDRLMSDPEFASQFGRPVLGVVVEDVDHEVHGEKLGERIFHAAICAWAKDGYLAKLLNTLLDDSYRIFLTSDHGFIEAETVGVSQAGVMADPHGRFERFSDPLIARQMIARSRIEGRLLWQNFGLPPQYVVVFAPLLGAMKQVGDRLLTHGGPTLEEVIVPWVDISR